MFEQLRICFYYGCPVGFLPDWVFQNYVAHGVPSRPTNPTDGQHALQRFRRKNILTFSCSTPVESAVKRCTLAYRSSDYVTYPIDPNTVCALHPELVLPAGRSTCRPAQMIRRLNDDALPSVQSSV